jgi:signal transduction histidine kinase
MRFRNWKKLVHNNFLSGLDPSAADAEVLRKVVLLNIVCLTGIFFLIPMGLLAFYQSNTYLGVFDWAVAVLLAYCLIHLRYHKDVTFVSYTGVFVVIILYWFLVFTGGVNNSAYVWTYTLPLFVMFLLGTRQGLPVILLFFIPILIFLVWEPDLPYATRYSWDLKMRFIPSFIVVVGYAYLFERVRERSYRDLKQENAHRRKALQELRIAKQKAESANRAKSDLLANMSHELRTPLNHIIGFTSLIADKHLGEINETQEEYLQDVLNSSQHLLSLINDILDLSKVEAGKMELRPERVALQELLKNSLSMIREKAQSQRIGLETRIDDVPETITADGRKLKQILYNLLSNAVKFTPDHGTIRLAAEHCTLSDGLAKTQNNRVLKLPTLNGASKSGDLRAIRFSVRDSGIGIAKDSLEKVFQLFEQVESNRTRKYHGTGLGLPLSRRFVELHGGAIWAESDGLNSGSTFIFIIPVKPD